ncbi:MAG: rhdA [Verrucomicrobiales bacterium]|nr:rhdA [Verrucomicrobiales bacterium]
MFKYLSALFACTLACCAANPAPSQNVVWHDARTLTVEGKGWTNTLKFYDRLPSSAKGVVRSPVWNLSQDSAGMTVRFMTDSPEIAARWMLRKSGLAMPHMPASGVSGLDLYTKENGKWHWVGAGRPTALSNELAIASGLKPGNREYMLYLPLYNGLDSLEIGVKANSDFEPAAPRPEKPIVFYGTSILQGGCASRPGMAYPAIVGRWLDWPTINLGFSGNAHSEPEVAALLAQLDPAVYVIDPLPNMQAALVATRIEPLVKTLRAAHKETPIILVENIAYCDAPFVEGRRGYIKSNAALKVVYENLKHSGIRNLYYLSAKGLIGDDGEGTVDGTHATDLGFERMAEKVTPILRKALHR